MHSQNVLRQNVPGVKTFHGQWDIRSPDKTSQGKKRSEGKKRPHMNVRKCTQFIDRVIPNTGIGPNMFQIIRLIWHVGRFFHWNVLSLGTFCPLGRFVPLVHFVWGTFCPLGRFVPYDVLSVGHFVQGTFCPLGRFVPRDVLSLGTFCPLVRFIRGTFCLRTFCLCIRN